MDPGSRRKRFARPSGLSRVRSYCHRPRTSAPRATGTQPLVPMEELMAKSIERNVHSTPSGIRVDLKTLYIYPDGHSNLVFRDDTNWPLADELQFADHALFHLFRPLLEQARREKMLRTMKAGLAKNATLAKPTP